MRYYLKKCGFQELGSVGEDGKAKRGRYLMTSMNKEVLDFFPPLSKDIPNDNALLLMLPLYTRLRTYCSYVYHNSKYTGTEAKHPRNEYRIYLNSELEGHKLYFEADDIMILRKAEEETIDDDNDFYLIELLKDHSDSEYIRLSRYIENYPIKGGYGVYDGVIDFFEERVKTLKEGDVAKDVVIDSSVTDRIIKSSKESQDNVFNPATFRDFVLAGYGNACAVTGQVTASLMGNGVDVVYIRPREEGGDCTPSNGIALAKDISLAFLQGKFTLSDQLEVVVHERNDNEYLKSLHLKQIRVPANAFFRPSIDNVKYHRENIFGKFDA